jgi:hypothetical protein
MKLISLTKVILFSVSFAALLVSVAQADPRGHHKKSTTLDQDGEERYVMVTGSNMPQKVTVRSIGTTTPYNVRIYTRHELDSTGRQTPAGALAVLDPSIQISGR